MEREEKFYKLKNRKRETKPVITQKAFDLLKTTQGFKSKFDVLYQCDASGKKTGEAPHIEELSEKKDTKGPSTIIRETTTEEIFGLNEKAKKK